MCYLNTSMERYKYLFIHHHHVPPEIRTQYKMAQQFDNNGYVQFEVQKRMCRLKQAGLLAYNQLIKHLIPHGYDPVVNTTGIWIHEASFTCVNKIEAILIIRDTSVPW